MKIAICGSMSLAKEMVAVKKELEIIGHKVVIPENTERYASQELSIESKWEKMESDVIRNYFEKIKEVDAILVINQDKNGIENYIGGNGLIEIAFAHVLNKKIFLLNPIPKLSYSDEIEAMKPITINSDLGLIK